MQKENLELLSAQLRPKKVPDALVEKLRSMTTSNFSLNSDERERLKAAYDSEKSGDNISFFIG